ncbi:MAG: Fe-S protein assembly co-chaperone HscB [Ferruginibacter sp.]|nr:Fe-S protein assembly co-chaperone HscB [Ferruginibacter sp.]
MNYFELFDLPVSLLTDRLALAKKYFELQKQYHPDFYTQADEAEQKEALERSSLVNKALKVLQQPDQTIQYVLQLKGLLTENEPYKLPPAFLMEMMELNEKLAAEDTVTFKLEVAAVEKELYVEVKDTIEKYNDTGISTEKLLKLKEYYFKKKYLQRILDRMDD